MKKVRELTKAEKLATNTSVAFLSEQIGLSPEKERKNPQFLKAVGFIAQVFLRNTYGHVFTFRDGRMETQGFCGDLADNSKEKPSGFIAISLEIIDKKLVHSDILIGSKIFRPDESIEISPQQMQRFLPH